MSLRSNILFWMCCFILGIMFFSVDFVLAKSLIEPGEYISDIFIKVARPDGTGRYEQGRFIRKIDDWSFVYCLEPFVDVDYDASYDIVDHDYEQFVHLSEEVWERVQLLSYYGYGYQDGNVDHVSDEKWYTITQVMIWRSVDQSADIYFTDTVNGNRNDALFLNEIAQMESLVAQHRILPEFDNQVVMRLGEEVVVDDLSGVLGKFQIVNVQGGKASILNDQLSLMATELGNLKVTLERKDRRYDSPTIVYYSSVSQNLIRAGSYKPIHVFVSYPVIERQFEITKVYASDQTQVMVPEIGVEFGIYEGDELMFSCVTDIYGKISFTLPYGHYVLKQHTTTDGYKKMDDYAFDVTENGPTIEKVFENKPIKVGLRVIKVDENGVVLALPGIRFRVKNLDLNEYVCQPKIYSESDVSCEFETDENGMFMFDDLLRFGHYQLEEIDQPILGYMWNSDPYIFSVDSSTVQIDDVYGPILEVRFVNVSVKGKVEIHKLGEVVSIQDGNYFYEKVNLPGVRFGLYDMYGNFVSEAITDENGQASFHHLPLGRYILKELESPFGYLLDTREYEIVLDYQNQYTPVVIKKLELVNELRKGTFHFTKIDSITGKRIGGVEIQIYTDDNQLIFTGVTDENGEIIVSDLFFGKFYVVETRSANGYLSQFEQVDFALSQDQTEAFVMMKNQRLEMPNTFHREMVNVFSIFGTGLVGVGLLIGGYHKHES